MDIDIDVIKKILDAVKAADKPISKVDGVPDREFNFNSGALLKSGLVDGPKPHFSSMNGDQVPDHVVIRSITMKGSEFAEAIRDETFREKFMALLAQHSPEIAFGLLSKIGSTMIESMSSS